jgi:hypothetical protein
MCERVSLNLSNCPNSFFSEFELVIAIFQSDLLTFRARSGCLKMKVVAGDIGVSPTLKVPT